MIRELKRSTLALAGVAALLLGACASNPADNPNVDDQAEVRPFTERGYDPTQSAPELADANNDGHQDTSTTAPRRGTVPTTMVVQTEGPQSTTTVTTIPDPYATSTTTQTMTSSSTSPSTSITDTTTQSTVDNTSTPATTQTTTTQTTTTMTSSAQTTDDATPARTRLRKD